MIFTIFSSSKTWYTILCCLLIRLEYIPNKSPTNFSYDVCLSAKNKVRLLPALNIPQEQLEKAIAILADVIEELAAQ